MNMSDSIFTKIIKGIVPAQKIYEDEKTLAFLDIRPVTHGHTLVVPKTQVDSLWDLDPESYQALMQTCQKVARRLQDVLKPARVGAKVMGIDVPHAHVHLIPFNTAEEFQRIRDMSEPPESSDNLNAMAERLRF